MFEQILIWYAKLKKVKSIRLRYFNACGAGYDIGEWHDPETHLIPLILKSVLDSKQIVSVFGSDYQTKDGTCVRDYIHVADLASAHYQAFSLLDQNNFMTDYFNLGTGIGVSVKEIVDLAKKITGVNFLTKIGDRRSGDPDEMVANPTKANKILGWRAQFSIEQVMVSAWECQQKLFKMMETKTSI